jgi:uncharacterized membrane protein YfhO
MPGWTATIDGRETVIHPVDGIFQGVDVPAGSHRLAFSYSPPYVGWGGLAFVVGVVGLFAPRIRRSAQHLAVNRETPLAM